MLSERLLPALLALLVLSAVVAPLSAGLASDRGDELIIERLVVLDPSGRVKKVESLGWRVPLARQPGCPSCGRANLEVLVERLTILANESRTSGRVTERLTAVRVERVVRDPSSPCPIYVGLDVVAYSRETPTYKASVVLLNYRSPRGGYVGSVVLVKVSPLDRDPVPRGEVVVVENPESVGRALGLAASHLRVDAGSVMRGLGLVGAVSEAVAGLASTTSGRVGELLGRETKFLAVILADPDNSSLTYAPSSSGDAREPDEGYSGECLTDQDCWRKGYSIDCFCTTACVEFNPWHMVFCFIHAGLCVGCAFKCVTITVACIECLAAYCPPAAYFCSTACIRWENVCHCPVGTGRWARQAAGVRG